VLATGGDGDDTFTTSATGASTDIYVRGTSAFDIDGGTGNDIIEGGNGFDVLKGGDGADTITGNRGNDLMSGGTGADTFNFGLVRYSFRTDTFIFGWDNDVITDFVVGEDRLNFGTLSGTVEDTAAGLLVTTTFVRLLGGPPPAPTSTASVLLEGVHGNYTLADLIL
jgi:Ca2+-binding RTX toxin-like protein